MRPPASEQFLKELKPGKIYRMKELLKSNSNAAHHARALVNAGKLTKVSPGKYLKQQHSKFGPLPPDFKHLVSAFLNGGEFLLVDTNLFGAHWLGFTQRSMTPVVLNRKRNGFFKLHHYKVKFERRRNFPRNLSVEFLLLYMLETRKQDDYGNLVKDVFPRMGVSYKPERLLTMARKYGKISTVSYLEETLASVSV